MHDGIGAVASEIGCVFDSGDCELGFVGKLGCIEGTEPFAGARVRLAMFAWLEFRTREPIRAFESRNEAESEYDAGREIRESILPFWVGARGDCFRRIAGLQFHDCVGCWISVGVMYGSAQGCGCILRLAIAIGIAARNKNRARL